MKIGEQRRYAFWFGVVFLVLLFAMFLIVFVLEIHKNSGMFAIFEFFFRTNLALASAGIAATIPGYLNVDWSKKFGLRAGGAFAVFLIVFTINPAKLTATISERQEVANLFLGCESGTPAGQLPSAAAENYCVTLLNKYPENWRAHLGMAKLKYVQNNFVASYEYAFVAAGLFRNVARVSLFVVLRDSDHEYFSEAKMVAHTLKKATWGIGGYWASGKLVRDQNSGLQPNSADKLFIRKFILSQSLSVFFHGNLGVAKLSESISDSETSILYENLYDACILSWQYLLDRDQKTKAKAFSKLKIFEERLSKRAGVRTAAQMQQISCLKSGSVECAGAPDMPRQCPVFSMT